MCKMRLKSSPFEELLSTSRGFVCVSDLQEAGLTSGQPHHVVYLPHVHAL